MTATTAPKKAAAATYPAVALALGLAAAGAIAVRDAVLAAGWITGTPWIPAVVGALDGLTPAVWTVAAGGAAALVGVVLVASAVAPRRARGLPVDAASAVFIEPTDIARVASAAAEQIPGVIAARTSVRRRTVTVRCRVTGPLDRAVIAEDVAAALRGLAVPARVRVTTAKEDLA